MIPVIIRHAGKKYEIEIDITEPGSVLKSQVYSLTGVVPERQKLLVKGGVLKDDADLSKLDIRQGHSFLVLGTAGDLPNPSASSAHNKSQHESDADDHSDEDEAKCPAGLVNLGNTCYMNASLQALNTVTELQADLAQYRGHDEFTCSLRDLYLGMHSAPLFFYPLGFLRNLRRAFPLFSEVDSQGRASQQDAEEALTQILSALQRPLGNNAQTFKALAGVFETTLTCAEAPEEPAKIQTEQFSKLSCHISIGTNFLRDGLLLGLSETLTKHSETLQRDAEYTLKKRITRLPKYLVVHYMRFFWRKDTNKKSKILRKVAFPFEFDATEFCSDELKSRIIPAREKLAELKRERDETLRSEKKSKTKWKHSTADASATAAGEASKFAHLKSQLEESLHPDIRADSGANGTGMYELSAIVTHQGATADSGHYLCFTKAGPGFWYKFNDTQVTVVDETSIQSLAGGGQADAALILLYKSSEI